MLMEKFQHGIVMVQYDFAKKLLDYDSNDKINDIGLDIRSCALGKASASIFLKNAKGLNLDDIKKVKKDLSRN